MKWGYELSGSCTLAIGPSGDDAVEGICLSRAIVRRKALLSHIPHPTDVVALKQERPSSNLRLP